MTSKNDSLLDVFSEADEDIFELMPFLRYTNFSDHRDLARSYQQRKDEGHGSRALVAIRRAPHGISALY